MFCRFFQFMISSAADSDSPVGRWTSRHVERCPRCRQFLQSCQRLAEGLRCEAAGWEQGSGQFHHRMPPDLASTQPLSHTFRIRTSLAAAACVTIAAAAMLYLTTPATPPSASTPTMGTAITPDTSWAAKWARLVENPLVTETKNLTSDTESGIRFLVACLDVRPFGADMTLQRGEPEPPPLP